MILRPTRCEGTKALPLGLALALLASLAMAPAGHAAVFLTWDWDEPTVETDGTETIALYATLSHTPQSSNSLPFNLQGYSVIPDTLVDTGPFTASNPYLLDTSGLFGELDHFSSDPLETDESITFLWGVLTPKNGQAPGGSYTLGIVELSFSSALFFDVESVLTVNVTPPVVVPGLSPPMLLVLAGALAGTAAGVVRGGETQRASSRPARRIR